MIITRLVWLNFNWTMCDFAGPQWPRLLEVGWIFFQRKRKKGKARIVHNSIKFKSKLTSTLYSCKFLKCWVCRKVSKLQNKFKNSCGYFFAISTRLSCNRFLGRTQAPRMSRFKCARTCVRISNLRWSHFAPAPFENQHYFKKIFSKFSTFYKVF